MTVNAIFIQLTSEQDKPKALSKCCNALSGKACDNTPVFVRAIDDFKKFPRSSIAYWASSRVAEVFERCPAFEKPDRFARQGLATANDFRFLRLGWEVKPDSLCIVSNLDTNQNSGTYNRLFTDATKRGRFWVPLAKGGDYSPWYSDVYLTVNWKGDGAEIKNFTKGSTGRLASRPQNTDLFFRPGLTWPLRTTSGLGIRVMPTGCAFGHKGPAAFVASDLEQELLTLLAVTVSTPFKYLVSLQLAAADAAARSYEVGVVQRTPVPGNFHGQERYLAKLAKTAWSLMRSRDTISESSHAFILPAILREKCGAQDFDKNDLDIQIVQKEIDKVCFNLYGIDESECSLATSAPMESAQSDKHGELADDYKGRNTDDAGVIGNTAGLLSWCVGVAFGHFDWRLATGEREVPLEPGPFDPVTAKSPGMLPDGAEPFHAHSGILVDDPGNMHDLPALVESVLEKVGLSVPDDTRKWVRREFFKTHLPQYSKSRRKAPIYWPLSTDSGSYTLWIYYPQLTDQTLYTCVNEYIDPKLDDIERELARLRGAGQPDTESLKRIDALVELQRELRSMREELLRVAKLPYKPNQNDGVLITAAPLWRLFSLRAWQQECKKCWAALDAGDYDWAHLAYGIWPDRVRGVCKKNKSIAIAHGLEELFEG